MTQYQVRVLGRLWMPQSLAATELTVKNPMEYPRADDETDAEYEARMVECAAELGDYSEIMALEIERINETWEKPNRKVTEFTMLREFSDDDRMAWEDCMFGGEE